MTFQVVGLIWVNDSNLIEFIMIAYLNVRVPLKAHHNFPKLQITCSIKILLNTAQQIIKEFKTHLNGGQIWSAIECVYEFFYLLIYVLHFAPVFS
jgi:hypothetical protein